MKLTGWTEPSRKQKPTSSKQGCRVDVHKYAADIHLQRQFLISGVPNAACKSYFALTRVFNAENLISDFSGMRYRLYCPHYTQKSQDSGVPFTGLVSFAAALFFGDIMGAMEVSLAFLTHRPRPLCRETPFQHWFRIHEIGSCEAHMQRIISTSFCSHVASWARLLQAPGIGRSSSGICQGIFTKYPQAEFVLLYP